MKKRLLQETNWSVFLVLLAALFLIVNYLAFRHYHRWDLTASRSFTISQETKKVLGELKEPLKVVVFLAPNDPLYERVKDLLDGYAAASSRVQVETIDPDRQRARMEALAQQYKVSMANVVVFALGGNSKYVEKDQMVDYDFSSAGLGGQPAIKSFKAEAAFTNAIFSLEHPQTPVIYFTTGHGERDRGGQGQGITLLKERLEKEGAKVLEWASLGKTEVPADASMLVIAGPKSPFLPQEAQVIDQYLQKGGKALFLLDPIIVSGKPPTFGSTGLGATLQEWGITLGRDIAVDPAASVPYLGAQTFFARAVGREPVVKDLVQNKLPVLLSLAESLTLGTPHNKAYHCEALLQSSPQSWGMRDLANIDKGVEKKPTDARGPLTMAAAVSSPNTADPCRLVVVGDSDLASDGLLQTGAGNLLFCLNSIHWLLSQASRLAIPPKTEVETHLSLTASQSNFLFILFVVILPGLVVAAGVFAYLRRRR